VVGGQACARCLISWFHGAMLSQEWKEAFWDPFVTRAPRSSERGTFGSSPLTRARFQNSNTAIASFARAVEPGAGDQPQDGSEMAQAGDGRGQEDRAEGPAVDRLDRSGTGGGGALPGSHRLDRQRHPVRRAAPQPDTIYSRPMRFDMICEVETWLRRRFKKPCRGGSSTG